MKIEEANQLVVNYLEAKKIKSEDDLNAMGKFLSRQFNWLWMDAEFIYAPAISFISFEIDDTDEQYAWHFNIAECGSGNRVGYVVKKIYTTVETILDHTDV